MHTVILADDHTMVRQGLRRIIEEHSDYKIVGETGDGLQIIPLIKKLQPDLLILDISIPNIRGIDSVRKIRKFNKKIGILVLTMHKNEEYVYECLVNGAQGYILKEDADTELLSAIKSIQKEDIYISPSFSSDLIKILVQRKSDIEKRTAYRDLTPREREILRLIAEGNTNKDTASKLGISVRTVEHHRLSIMRKLNTPNIASLVLYAIKNGLVAAV